MINAIWSARYLNGDVGSTLVMDVLPLEQNLTLISSRSPVGSSRSCSPGYPTRFGPFCCILTWTLVSFMTLVSLIKRHPMTWRAMSARPWSPENDFNRLKSSLAGRRPDMITAKLSNEFVTAAGRAWQIVPPPRHQYTFERPFLELTSVSALVSRQSVSTNQDVPIQAKKTVAPPSASWEL